MTQLLNYLLTFVLIYGYPTIVAIVLIGAIGIPLPATSILVAAGSFTVDGTLNMYVLIPLVAITALCGDILGYYLGRKLGTAKNNFFMHRIDITKSMEGFFANHGVWSVFITRWLITPLAVPINILAGIHRYSFVKFMIIVFLGELLWAGLYLYLGYLFGANWQALLDYINNTPQVLAIAAIGIILLLMAVHRRKNPFSSKK